MCLLQNLSDSIVDPLELIFNKSIAESAVPQDWKDAFVVPIFKKGSKSIPNNYRPVSLTSVVCKLMETIIKNRIMDYLLENSLIRASQHGFLPNKSCPTNPLEFLEV